MRSVLLLEFQKYLISNWLSEPKEAPFLAYWASRFISFSNENNSVPLDDRIRLYLDFLKVSELREDWQIRQAGDSIRLYIDHFLDGDRTIFATVKGATPVFLDDLKSDAMKRMRETLRIQNYAYRTEKTYLDWVNRYFFYCKSVNAPVTGRDASDSRFVKAYISHLALERDVAASTQNQAFNALLFLYSKVFEIDLQGLGDTVRARLGAKLPVVLRLKGFSWS